MKARSRGALGTPMAWGLGGSVRKAVTVAGQADTDDRRAPDTTAPSRHTSEAERHEGHIQPHGSTRQPRARQPVGERGQTKGPSHTRQKGCLRDAEEERRARLVFHVMVAGGSFLSNGLPEWKENPRVPPPRLSACVIPSTCQAHTPRARHHPRQSKSENRWDPISALPELTVWETPPDRQAAHRKPGCRSETAV